MLKSIVNRKLACEPEEMMLECGFEADHTTLYPLYTRDGRTSSVVLQADDELSWRVDETYVKVKGKWAYLYRAIDKRGHTIDFYLSPTRNTQAAK